jgi:hypothetical protein
LRARTANVALAMVLAKVLAKVLAMIFLAML